MPADPPTKIATLWNEPGYSGRNGSHPLVESFICDTSLFTRTNPRVPATPDFIRKLDKKLRIHIGRNSIYDAAKSNRTKINPLSVSKYCRFFDDRMYSVELADDHILFEHSAVPIGLDHDFIFHFESFTTIMHPIAWTGKSKGFDIDRNATLDFFTKIFSNPRCKFVFTHIQRSKKIFENFFRDFPEITEKIFFVPIGINVDENVIKHHRKYASGNIKILFTNSFHNIPFSFYLRGGHILLEAYSRLRKRGMPISLTIVSSKPRNLADRFRNEIIEEIDWYETSVSHDELKKLKSEAHIFALPSVGLHSYSLLEAMTNLSIPIVTDALGYEEYISEDRNFIPQIKGVFKEYYYPEPDGWISEDYSGFDENHEYYIAQMERLIEKIAEQDIRKLAEKNMEYVRRFHNIEQSNKNLHSLLKKIR
jgi:hypothetical protein